MDEELNLIKDFILKGVITVVVIVILGMFLNNISNMGRVRVRGHYIVHNGVSYNVVADSQFDIDQVVSRVDTFEEAIKHRDLLNSELEKK